MTNTESRAQITRRRAMEREKMVEHALEILPEGTQVHIAQGNKAGGYYNPNGLYWLHIQRNGKRTKVRYNGITDSKILNALKRLS